MLFCWCSFITVVKRTVEKQQLQRQPCRKISVAIFTFIAEFLQMDFDTKSSSFLFNISVTSYSKGNTVKFSRFYFTFISKIVT